MLLRPQNVDIESDRGKSPLSVDPCRPACQSVQMSITCDGTAIVVAVAVAG